MHGRTRSYTEFVNVDLGTRDADLPLTTQADATLPTTEQPGNATQKTADHLKSSPDQPASVVSNHSYQSPGRDDRPPSDLVNRRLLRPSRPRWDHSNGDKAPTITHRGLTIATCLHRPGEFDHPIHRRRYQLKPRHYHPPFLSSPLSS